jgi:hypothetical protein
LLLKPFENDRKHDKNNVSLPVINNIGPNNAFTAELGAFMFVTNKAIEMGLNNIWLEK